MKNLSPYEKPICTSGLIRFAQNIGDRLSYRGSGFKFIQYPFLFFSLRHGWNFNDDIQASS
jgi:hypothetical protein